LRRQEGQRYVQRRSDLLGQKRRLVAVYGANSPEAASIDRQIAIVDEALAERRAQLMEDERARETLRQMKQEAAPGVEASEAASTQTSRQTGSAEGW